jgi:hypothetical protein
VLSRTEETITETCQANICSLGTGKGRMGGLRLSLILQSSLKNWGEEYVVSSACLLS